MPRCLIAVSDAVNAAPSLLILNCSNSDLAAGPSTLDFKHCMVFVIGPAPPAR